MCKGLNFLPHESIRSVPLHKKDHTNGCCLTTTKFFRTNQMASSKPKNGGKSSKGTSGKGDSAERVVAENRKARHHYEILDTLECGIALVGSEVKSLRSGKMSLDEAYGRVKGNEVWLIGCDIPEYVKANQLNHQPKRPRKLLLHRREIVRFASLAYEKSLTLVPLKAYFCLELVEVGRFTTSDKNLRNRQRNEILQLLSEVVKVIESL